MNEILYEYSSADFLHGVSCERNSKFTAALCQAWDLAMENGAFWYNLDGVERKVLAGRYRITAQLNQKRFSERRKPETATQVMMSFNPDKFHFNKIKQSEILFKLNRIDIQKERNDKIIINVSPIEYGHVLLVPNIDCCLPQVLDEHAIEAAVEVCLLSDSGLRIGFNSLCALASVNHLHFHAFQYKSGLPIDTTRVQPLNNNIYSLDDYMINGFVLQLSDSDIKTFARSVVRITSFLCKKNVAHNLAISRHVSLHSADGCYVTVFIFPKKASPECTNDPFNTASLECSGFLPMQDHTEYSNMTEESAIQTLNKFTYTDDEFRVLSNELLASCY